MRTYLQLTILFILFTGYAQAQRDPYKWPFAQNSIWNLPIHENAVYVDAKIGVPAQAGLLNDEDYLVLTPSAPSTQIYTNYAGWDRNKNRCPQEGPLLFNAPIPGNFVINQSNWLGDTPNAGLAVLMPDGVTIKQTQPFARCNAGSYGTSQYVFGDVNIYEDGIEGAHGGSHMSAIGGTIRLGELVPGGTIRHAIKINLYAAKYLYYDEATGGKRWPAPQADGYAPSVYGTLGNPEYECRMGALLALKSDLDLNSLNFETGSNGPAMILAKAFQDYGAYIVDDTYWDVVAIPTEFSPEGRVNDEFYDAWGYHFETGTNTPFGRDMAKIITRLHVITNNTASTTGGGPTTDLTNRRAPAACAFDIPGSGLMCPSGPPVAVTGVSVSPSSANINIGLSQQLTATVTPANATNKNVTWNSSNTAVALVNSSGLVTAVSAGTAIITAATQDGNFTEVSSIIVTESPYTKFSGTGIGSPGSYNNLGNTFEMALDNDLSTYFDGATSNGQWVGLDLGTAQTLKEVRFAPRPQFTDRLIGGIIQASDNADFSAPIILHTINAAPPAGILTSVMIQNAVAYQYVRYLSPDGSWGNIAEIEFWGLEDSQDNCTATGSILSERWNNIAGTSVNDLINHSNYPDNPSSSTQLQSFEIPSNSGDNYGVRLRGYICPPTTGNYTFWLASDDNGQLLLSTDDSPSNVELIAWHTSWTGSREWNKFSTQKSATKYLEQGIRYYVEALMKEGIGGDNLAVGWAKPGQGTTTPSEVIPGSALSPWVASTIAVTGVSVSPTSASIDIGTTQQLTATVSPSNATNKSVGWSTSDASVATVNSSGLVTGVDAGTVIITVTTVDGEFIDTSSITVNAVNNDIVIFAAGKDNTENMSLKLDGTTVASWSNIGGNVNNGQFVQYTYSTTEAVNTVEVHFTNDNGNARDLRIDKIMVNSITYEAENAASFDAWGGSSCNPTGTEWLWCNGYKLFNVSSSARIGITEVETELQRKNDIIPEISIYPNPANSSGFTIEINGKANIEGLEIYSAAGTLVYRQVLMEKSVKKSIDTQNFTNGLYLIKILSGKEVVTRKLIVE